MLKKFTFQDNLGNMLSSSHKPYTPQTTTTQIETVFEGFEDYMNIDNDYAIYSETSPDTVPKYTMISKPTLSFDKLSPDNHRTPTLVPSSGVLTIPTQPHEQIHTSEKEVQTDKDNDDFPNEVPAVQDVLVSKLLEQSHMSTINTIYIGSLSIIGLYVLFRYMKY